MYEKIFLFENEDSKSIEFNITQKKIEIPAPSNMAYTYTGSEITYDLELDELEAPILKSDILHAVS